MPSPPIEEIPINEALQQLGVTAFTQSDGLFTIHFESSSDTLRFGLEKTRSKTLENFTENAEAFQLNGQKLDSTVIGKFKEAFMTDEYEELFKSQNAKGKSKGKEDDKIRAKSQVYKSGNNHLAEAVVIGQNNRPYWIISDSLSGQISVHEYIEIIDEEGHKKILYAPKKSTYLNEPYTFESVEQINELIQDVKAKETLDTLFSKIKKQWSRYVNQPEAFINLCCGDCIFTLFQDRLGSTHYLFFIADTEAGKSTNLLMFKILAYRCFLGLDITTSNIYRFYGNDYEGIGTLCEDELTELDEEQEKLKLYKGGYTKGFKVPKNLKDQPDSIKKYKSKLGPLKDPYSNEGPEIVSMKDYTNPRKKSLSVGETEEKLMASKKSGFSWTQIETYWPEP
jgi:hypothetical protein